MYNTHLYRLVVQPGFYSDTVVLDKHAEVPGSILGQGQNEPRREKTGLRGFRPGPTQTGLYKIRKELEA